ncbi:hypothetical protein H2204_009399 [Knufia peltigerae]|uniref:DNA mismatch repair protein S5 domain-containing protein n=1 Tax=Knufia peltigerae TaxID=1002370 RepID=A0AA39CV70_9EURO|nr:hypothetical protein H2204_009399 [Knufia peltigerae]
MPIEALPETTTRALGSTLVLNDAKSVVKELVDNALDARATAISIEISSNTIDTIQVKDNGTGVDVQDRRLLCKRGCTSKIRSLHDLSRLGGTFLGFRGEALASMAELSSVVSVTTRVEGEVVGTALEYTTAGLKSSASASHPVGTTFRVQDFLTKIPVRKQTALRGATKTLHSIKSLLFTYAFARRDVRFSLKVLKAKNEKSDWIYAASRNASLSEVATKIVGKEIVSECKPYRLSPTEDEEGIEDGWSLDTLLVSPDADVVKTRSGPQFLSVDGRPVSTERGIMKEIVKSYKRHVHRILPKSTSVSRPFLCMQIRCPPESYDVNVEPAKDEVLFFRPDILLSLVERLFKTAYGDFDTTTTGSPGLEYPEVTITSAPNTDAADLQDVETTTLMDREASPLAPSEIGDSFGATTNPFSIAAMNKIVLPRKMDEYAEATATSAFGARLAARGPGMYTPDLLRDTHRPESGQQEQLPSPISEAGSDVLPYQNPGPPKRPWPRKNRQISDMSFDPRNHHEIDDTPGSQQMGLETWLTPQNQLQSSISQAAHRIAQGRTLPTHHDIVSAPTQTGNRTGNSQRTPIAGGRLQSGSGQKPFKSPFKRTMHASSQSSLDSATPFNDYGAPTTGFGRCMEVGVQSSPQRVRDHRASESDEGLSPGSAESPVELAEPVDSLMLRSELSEIMDFEQRKKAAIAHQRKLAAKYPSTSLREILRQRNRGNEAGPELDGTGSVSASDFEDLFADFSPDSITKSNNPHRNRYLAAKRGLLSHSHPERDEVSATTTTGSDDGDAEGRSSEDTCFDLPEQLHPPFEDDVDDPRGYLSRQRRRQQAGNSKLYRTKSSKLPFETIPPHAMTLKLAIASRFFKDKQTFERYARKLGSVDKYVTFGTIQSADNDIHEAMNDDYTNTLREMVKTKYRFKNSEGKEIVPHLKINLTGKKV